jgi:hypothetical protein
LLIDEKLTKHHPFGEDAEVKRSYPLEVLVRANETFATYCPGKWLVNVAGWLSV